MRRRSRAGQDDRRFPRLRRWSRRIGIGCLVLVVVLGCVYWALPKGPRDPMDFGSPKGETRPMATGSEHAVVAGTPWAAEAMRDVLEAGGNAAGAAIAGLLALNVTLGEAARPTCWSPCCRSTHDALRRAGCPGDRAGAHGLPGPRGDCHNLDFSLVERIDFGADPHESTTAFVR